MKKLVSFLTLVMIFFGSVLTFPAEARVIKMSWDANTEPDLAGYKIYWGITYNEVANKVNFLQDVGNKTCACIDVDDGSYKFIFLGVTAYDTQGFESSATVGYVLFGNIIGDYNNGTPYTSAQVDGTDLITLGLHFGEVVTHPTYDCAGTFAIELPADAQKADLNYDNWIDGFDLIYLGLRFGNYIP